MLDTLPTELIVLIFNDFNFDDLVICILISKRYKKIIKNIHIKVANFLAYTYKDIQILHTFKLDIKKLHLCEYYISDKIFKCVNLSKINYEILVFDSIDWEYNKIQDLIELDSEISEKCKKIIFYGCQNYSLSLITSFKILKNCKIIKIHGSHNLIGSDFCRIILEILDVLPELTILFDEWELSFKDLELLWDHERIILKRE